MSQQQYTLTNVTCLYVCMCTNLCVCAYARRFSSIDSLLSHIRKIHIHSRYNIFRFAVQLIFSTSFSFRICFLSGFFFIFVNWWKKKFTIRCVLCYIQFCSALFCSVLFWCLLSFDIKSTLMVCKRVTHTHTHIQDRQNVEVIRKWNWKDSRSTPFLTTTKNDYVCIRNQNHFLLCIVCVCLCSCAFLLDGLKWNMFPKWGVKRKIKRAMETCCDGGNNALRTLHSIDSIFSKRFRCIAKAKHKISRFMFCTISICLPSLAIRWLVGLI